nr:hypothetical protein CFP56_19932 [Quercus suber]
MGGTCVAIGWWCGGPGEGWFCNGSMFGDGGHRLLTVAGGGTVKVVRCTTALGFCGLWWLAFLVVGVVLQRWPRLTDGVCWLLGQRALADG